MKRVKAACVCQTLHFMVKDDLKYDIVVKLISEEVAKYKTTLTRKRIKFKILSEETQPDGSVIIKIIKQYSMCPVGEYLD